VATCYRHPDRETAVSCSMCARPICPDCMTSTPVGMRCPECARDRTRVATGPAASLASPPYVTYALIALNVIAFLAIVAGGGSFLDGGGTVTADYGLCGPAIAEGGICPLSGGLVVSEDGGELYRIVTGAFLHGGIIHLGLNMLVLFILGRLLEPGIGGARLAAIYFVSLLAGSFGALLLDPDKVTVGASGAIFGLMAAAFVIARKRGMEALSNEIGVLVAINLVITFTIPNISIGGHIGGLVGGGLAALAITAGERQEGARGLSIQVGGLIAVGIASVLGALGAAAG
ncbi:MAG TPA: rhomboid family intramembrane serine protease, partial [Solirubrobacterales bacterium]